jgi:arylsulfatase
LRLGAGLVHLKLPLLVNLRSDPFEEADLSGDMYYWKWRADRVFMLLPAGAIVAEYLKTMIEFPPRQSSESWTPEQMMEKLKKNAAALQAAAHPG